MTFPFQITTSYVAGSHNESEHFLTVGSIHIQYYDLDSITQARATYCINWNPWKYLMQYFQRKNNFFHLFFTWAYIILQCIVFLTITSDQANWLVKLYFLFSELLTLYTLTSVCIFSLQLSKYFLRCWEGELI